MAIKCKKSKAQINTEFMAKVSQLEQDIINLLIIVGEQFVRDARQNLNIDTSIFHSQRVVTASEMKRRNMSTAPSLETGEYLDFSGNLRSSIGFCVTHNGIVVHKDLTGTPEGVQAAEDAIRKVPKTGWFHLYAVAGMDYASYVESKGYNVITSQAQSAVVNLDSFWRGYVKAKKLKIK